MIMSHHLQSMTQIKYMSRLHQLWRLANVHQAIVRNACSQQLIITLINSCNTTLNWIRVSKSLHRFSAWNNHRSSAKIVTNTKNGVADNNCTDESPFPSSFSSFGCFYWLVINTGKLIKQKKVVSFLLLFIQFFSLLLKCAVCRSQKHRVCSITRNKWRTQWIGAVKGGGRCC